MSALAWLRKLGSKGQSKTGGTLILPVLDQIKAWRKVSGKMGWGITQDEFNYFLFSPLEQSHTVIVRS